MNTHPVALSSAAVRRTPAVVVWGGRLLVGLAFAALVYAAAPLLARFAGQTLAVVAFPYPLNYGEGPLLDQALRLGRGENIYRPDLDQSPLIIANYPPLYVGVVAAFGGGTPDYTPGRVLALVSTLIAALALAGIVGAAARSWVGGGTAAVVFVCVPYVLHWAALHRVDMPALALSLCGLLALVVRHDDRTLLVSAVLLALAVYMRQTYLLAAPLAACAWLVFVWREPLRAVVFALVFGNLVVVPFAALVVASDGGIFTHVVRANVNAWLTERLHFFAAELADGLPVLLACAGVVGAWGVVDGLTRRVRGTRTAARAAVLALPVAYGIGAAGSAVTIGKIGSDVNYLLEFAAALCLAAGVLVGLLAPRAEQQHRAGAALVWRGLQCAVLAALTWQVGVGVVALSTRYYDILALRMLPDREGELATLLDEIGQGSYVLADEPIGLLPLAGRGVLFQPFERSQMAHDGVWDERAFVAALEDGVYDRVLIYQPMALPTLYLERWTPAMRRALNSAYRPVRRVGETTVLVPIG